MKGNLYALFVTLQMLVLQKGEKAKVMQDLQPQEKSKDQLLEEYSDTINPDDYSNAAGHARYFRPRKSLNEAFFIFYT
jgi:hypothetical protein